MYVQDSTTGQGLTLKNDGTYEVSGLSLTSANSGNIQVETGTFVVDGNSITITPKQWSCAGPDPVASYRWELSGSDLIVSNAGGMIAYTPNTSATNQAFALTVGCFDSKTGAFTPRALSPVTN
jgi:hypothetical protein